MKTKCLNDTLITAYLSKRLSRKELNDVEKHLADCPYCRQDVLMISRVSRDPEFSSWRPFWYKPVQERLKSKVSPIKNFIKDIFSFSPNHTQLAFARSRNTENQTETKWKFRQVEITTTIQQLEVQISIKEFRDDWFDIRIHLMDRKQKYHGLTLYLQKENGTMDACGVQNNYVVFEELSPGNHQLMIEDQSNTLGSISFELTNEGIYGKDTVS
jgi:hypothetical protein